MLWVIFLATIGLDVCLGFLVWAKGRKKRLNKLFALFCFNLALVSLLNFLLHFFPQVFFVRLIYAAASFIPAVGILWIFELGKKKLSKLKLGLLLLVALSLFSLSLFTDLIVKDFFGLESFGCRIEEGKLFRIFYLNIFVSSLIGGVKLYLAQRYAPSIEKLRIKYMMLGLLLYGVLAFVFSFILPSFFGVYSLTDFDSLGVLVFVAFSAYAIGRHRLMGIRLAIRLMAGGAYVYFLMTVFLVVFLAGASLINEMVCKDALCVRTFLVGLLAITLYAMFFKALLRWVKSSRDKIFFRSCNPWREMKNLLLKAREEKSLKNFYELLESEFRRVMRARNVTVILFSRVIPLWRGESKRKNGCEYKKGSYNLRPVFKRVPFCKSALFRRVRESEEIIIRDELEADEKTLITEMYRYEASIVVPLAYQNKIIGVILLGGKDNRKGYSQSDICYLDILRGKLARKLVGILKEKRIGKEKEKTE